MKDQFGNTYRFVSNTYNMNLDLSWTDRHHSLEYMINCDRCKDREAEIFHEQGDYCLSCWQEVTSPI